MTMNNNDIALLDACSQAVIATLERSRAGVVSLKMEATASPRRGRHARGGAGSAWRLAARCR